MEYTSEKIGIIGKTNEASIKYIASHLFPNINPIYVNSIEDAKDCTRIYVLIQYPYTNESLIKELKANSKSTLNALILDTLAIEPMLKVLECVDNIECFSQDVKNKLLVHNLSSSKISVSKISFSHIDNKESLSHNIKVFIPSMGLKNEHVDLIISLAYKVKEISANFEFLCYGTEKDQSSGGFSKYFSESVQQKGFSNQIRLIKHDFLSRSNTETNKVGNFTLIINNTEQNQRESLLNVLESLYNNIPVILSSELPQCENIPGVAKFVSISNVESNVKKILEYISSKNLVDELKNQIFREGVLTKEVDLSIESKSSPAIITLSKSIPRILMQNRGNAFMHPGGDTVVMQKIFDNQDPSRIQIDVCVDGSKNPKDYDLVHLFNFAIREITEQQARTATDAKTPYVVTTLYEDWPLFYNQMANMYLALKTYSEHGQPKSNWLNYEDAAKQVAASEKWDNSYAANNAEALIATGNLEVQALKRDYPLSKNVINIPLGCEVTNFYDSGKLFKEKYGITDFVLCVGRLEWRKNQLMLLKALEDVNIPVVFAASSFTYQPEYEKLCKEFKRKGETHFIGRLSDEELASAYQAARVHALPSWFELPGLVTIEAAKYGTPVVTTKFGTIEDYIGNSAFYCHPGNAESIRNSILNAYHAGKSEELASKVAKYTWKNTTEKYTELYESVLEGKLNLNNSNTAKNDAIKSQNQEIVINLEDVAISEEDNDASDLFDDNFDYCVEGDICFRSGKIEQAREAYLKDLNSPSRQGRANRSLGALELYLKNYPKAESYFNVALELDQFDSKALLGKGAILWERGEKETAFKIYKQASDFNPNDQSALLYLVNYAYELNKLAELEDCLRRYLRENPSNIHIQYCLAGCYYKQEKYSAALGVLERLLILDSNYKDGTELKELIENKLNEKSNKISKLQEQIEIVKQNTETENKLEKNISFSNNKLVGTKELSELEELKATRQYDTLIEKAETLSKDDRYCDTALDHFDILKAEAYGCIGNVQTAKEILGELRSRNVQLGRVLCDLGALELASSNQGLASKLFEEALAFEPNNDNAFAGLAMCAQSDGRLEDAWTLFEESLRKNSQNIQAIYGLVQLGYEFKRLDKVEKFLREYLELKPIDISILYSLAGCLYAQGKSEEAVGELKNILLFDPQNEPALELMEKISFEDRPNN